MAQIASLCCFGLLLALFTSKAETHQIQGTGAVLGALLFPRMAGTLLLSVGKGYCVVLALDHSQNWNLRQSSDSLAAIVYVAAPILVDALKTRSSLLTIHRTTFYPLFTDVLSTILFGK